MLLAIFSLVLFSSSQALRWPNNASYRVSTMGGATLAIEDETTALNLFNHQNPAGLAMLEKENRIDFGIGYQTDSVKLEGDNYTNENSVTKMDLTRPGGEYRGLTYWLNDDMVMRANIEGSIFTIKQTTTPDSGSAVEEELTLNGLGGNVGFATKFPGGFALGAELGYFGAAGEPKDLTGGYDFYEDGSTEKFKISYSLFNWSIGAGYQLLDLGGKDNTLEFGLTLHNDDDLELTSGFVMLDSAQIIGTTDYNLKFDISNGDISQTQDIIHTPIAISGEAIYKMGGLLEAGLLFDYIMTDQQLKASQETSEGTTEFDIKTASATELVISPVIQANIKVGDDMAILPGLTFHNAGSINIDNYSLDRTTTEENDTFKSSNVKIDKTLLGLGVGLQALNKAIQLGLQFEAGGWDTTTENYDENGNSTDNPNIENVVHGNISNFRFGAEFWVTEMIALRAGYAVMSVTTVDGYTDTTSLFPSDLVTTTNRLTFGAGYKSENDLRVDLLIGMDTITDDPKSDPEPEKRALDIMLAAKIPL